MSEKHEAAVRRLLEEGWNKGNMSVVDEVCTRDIVHTDPVDPVRGVEAFKAKIMKFRTAFPDLRFEFNDLFFAGDRVVAVLRMSGTHRAPYEGIAPTGRHASVTGQAIYRFAGDRITELNVVWDALGMMQQLGVVTLPGKAAGAGA